ncbi:unnamed protein product [Didymodactylos carnosus]|uniref:VWFA domain-containing protein n=1 Tax=Didymodactylos carnosus TaxID=1234261 RepID=A0A813VAH6_9BILA|nr:unnamed protein product [Didymodactylos carnosus]CAF0833895.1 unnamed protein product [Didymodactylos carnosus]CAF3561186.1 unnamed protein product [Didymodactylos carnosus]CAF3621006.1 unnamed protein product [Didymodactylos carnosus]
MDENEDQYRWETGYERTWEVIQEDESGSISATVNAINQKNRRNELAQIPNVRLGMMRHLYVVLDMSEAMKDQDLRPTRLFCAIELLKEFVSMYFDSNPISQIGILVTKKKRVEKISELAGNPRSHINLLEQLRYQDCEGESSIQNALELGLQTLKHMPKYSSREMLFVLGSLTTCDPGNISQTIKLCKENEIRCSVISLSAEVRIFRKLCTDTKGLYHVIMDSTHFQELLQIHSRPLPALTKFESSLVRMGFPKYRVCSSESQTGNSPTTTTSLTNKQEKASMCMCHLEQRDGSTGFSISGYFCPTCESKYCELPTECSVCHLTLVSAPHLARSYHFLFFVEQFIEIPRNSSTISNGNAHEHNQDETNHTVNGGGSGIGLEITRQLGLHGCKVAVMGRRADVLKSAVDSLSSEGITAIATPGDVRSNDDAVRAVQQTVEKYGQLDILVNSAAGNFLSAAEDLSPKGFRTVMEIDAIGVFTMCHATFSELRKSNNANIINISANLQYPATWYQVHASAAKAAIDSITRSLALEWGEYKIRVNGIVPGLISGTPGFTKLGGDILDTNLLTETSPLGRPGEKHEVAMGVVYLCSTAGSFITGHIMFIDGGNWLMKPKLAARDVIKAFSRNVEKKSRQEGLPDTYVKCKL